MTKVIWSPISNMNMFLMNFKSGDNRKAGTNFKDGINFKDSSNIKDDWLPRFIKTVNRWRH